MDQNIPQTRLQNEKGVRAFQGKIFDSWLAN